jgi:hypothetical protein
MNDFAALDGVFGENDCEEGPSRLISWYWDVVEVGGVGWVGGGLVILKMGWEGVWGVR